MIDQDKGPAGGFRGYLESSISSTDLFLGVDPRRSYPSAGGYGVGGAGTTAAAAPAPAPAAAAAAGEQPRMEPPPALSLPALPLPLPPEPVPPEPVRGCGTGVPLCSCPSPPVTWKFTVRLLP